MLLIINILKIAKNSGLYYYEEKRTHQNCSTSEANKLPSTVKASLAIISIVVDGLKTLECCSSSRY